MAGPYYVRSTDGNDGDDGLTWATAKATLGGALSVAAAGERIYVSQAHAQTQASALSLSSPGTAAAPVEIICVEDSAEPPTTLAVSGSVATNGAFSISFAGFAYVYGLIFNAGTGAGQAAGINFTSASPWAWTLEWCSLRTPGSGSASELIIGANTTGQDDVVLKLINTTIQLGAVGTARVNIRSSRFLMDGGGFITSSTPSGIIGLLATAPGFFRLRGVDLSLFGSGKHLVTIPSGCGPHVGSFENCLLGASVALTSGTFAGPGSPIILMDNCDSGDSQVRMQRTRYEGSVFSETTVVRTGGASNGVTPISHRMVSSASRVLVDPLLGPEMVIWNPTVASRTVTVEILHDSVTALQDDEVWLEVEYLGVGGEPRSSFGSDRMSNILSTPADQESSSATWVTTGITNPNKQKLSVGVPVQEVGILRARVALAKPSYTVYVDPLLTVT
jgi:hypothetical protein